MLPDDANVAEFVELVSRASDIQGARED
jgi:hypothetical protein